MKNLYTKSKGKIHPSPSSPSSADGDVVVVLKLLPAAILALTAALGFEDQEVVAYLMLRSINGPVAAAEDLKRLRHRPMFDCGCFDCYTSFWSRWDCSPDRETIHMAIEGFEEHLASTERKGKGKGKGKRRERREKKRESRKKGMEKEAPVAGPAEESKGLVEEVSASECSFTEETKAEEMEVVTESEVESLAVGGGERRGWPDVMGMLNSRLWNLWSPGM